MTNVKKKEAERDIRKVSDIETVKPIGIEQ